MCIILFSPVMLLSAILVKATSKGPLIFAQERVGLHNKPFQMYKFRSMEVQAKSEEKKGWTIKNDPRVTPVGRFIRKTSIDELPQLFNVLKGDMTFVGTRPEVPKYVAHYTEEMMATFLLPAGVTSRTSIEYKDEEKLLENAENADEVYINEVLPAKMVYNLREIEKFSFLRDICTMVKTVIAVIK